MAALQANYDCAENIDLTLHPDTPHKFTPIMWQNCLDWFVNHLQ